MKRTIVHITSLFALFAMFAVMQLTAVAQQTAGAATQAQPPVQRPRAAAQAANKAAKAEKQAAKESRGLAADQPKQPKQNEQQRNKRAQQIADVYVSGLQNGVGLSTEQTQKLSPFVGNFVRRQLVLAQQKNDAKKRLQDLSDQHASDQDIQTQYNQMELAQTQLENSRRQFFANINPQLTPKQRADLIQYMDRTDQSIRQLIQKAQ